MLDRLSDDDEYDATDRRAFRRALATVARDPFWGPHFKERLADGQSWAKVGQTASYHCQVKSLGLKPWQSPPCDNDGSESADLLDRMLDAGLSQWEPDPAKALARAKRRR